MKNMTIKEISLKLGVGFVIYFLVYSLIIYLTKQYFDIVESLIMGFFWSLGMILFEWTWMKLKANNQDR